MWRSGRRRGDHPCTALGRLPLPFCVLNEFNTN